MSDAMLQKTIDLVSSMEAKNETQQLAKYELIEYTERLHKENQELKKQLEKKYKKVGTLTGELLYEENTKLINQQKEFIEWLEQKVKKYTPNLRVSELDEFGYRVAQYINAEVYEIPPEDVVKEVLSKYKEIIGEEM